MLAGLHSPLASQVATVSGSLLNHDSRTPIVGAHVAVLGTGLGVNSDTAGRFELRGVPAGVRVLQARAVGYVVASWVVELGEGQILRQIFELAPRAIEVEAVTVTARDEGNNWRTEAGFEHRRLHGRGFFITRQQIQQRQAQNVSDLLRSVPGVMTTCRGRNCTVQMLRSTRQCSPEYFLDGYPATFATGASFPISPAAIRGVEIYRDEFEVPAEFQRSNLRCGVIAIWTIEPGTPLGR